MQGRHCCGWECSHDLVICQHCQLLVVAWAPQELCPGAAALADDSWAACLQGNQQRVRPEGQGCVACDMLGVGGWRGGGSAAQLLGALLQVGRSRQLGRAIEILK
jgi:hypothetical protein